jgi:hypothetical protein
VGVKKIDGELSGDEARDGRDNGEGFLLFQHRGLIDLGYRIGFVMFQLQGTPRYRSSSN